MAVPEFSSQHISWIRPRLPTPPKVLPLSTLDSVPRNMPYNRRVVFYDCVSVNRLKASLSDVLVHFYPAAGRLLPDEGGRFSIDCNDQGVEFVETAVAGLSMEEVGEDNFQMKPIFNKLARWERHAPEEMFRIPLFSVQVTHFDLGGVALGVAICHILADGGSLWHLMKSWAECCRGVPLSMPPIHDRTPLMVDRRCEDLASLNYEHVEPISGRPQEQQSIAQRVFRFSKTKLQRLKDEVASQSPHPLTTYQVLCAHIWKSVTRARGHQDADTLCFGGAANFSSKMEPPLPGGYFGNAVMWIMTQTTAGQLHKDSLAETASRVQASVLACKPPTVNKFLHWLELNGADNLLNRMRLDGCRMRVSSSPRFAIFEVDFGWGKPLAVRTCRVEEQGKIVLFPTREGDGSIDVCMALATQHMHILENDPDFL